MQTVGVPHNIWLSHTRAKMVMPISFVDWIEEYRLSRKEKKSTTGKNGLQTGNSSGDEMNKQKEANGGSDHSNGGQSPAKSTDVHTP